jgi:hypothetical protein
VQAGFDAAILQVFARAAPHAAFGGLRVRHKFVYVFERATVADPPALSTPLVALSRHCRVFQRVLKQKTGVQVVRG